MSDYLENDYTDDKDEDFSMADSGASAAPEVVADDLPPKKPRPAGLPDKFWDDEKGEVRAGSLWRSYQTLENRYHQGDVGYPPSPEEYCIDCGDRHADPEVNAILHDARFTNDQAQLVYDLARKYVVPELEAAERKREAALVQGRLEETFGGAERWQRVAKQLGDWGKAHLPDEVMDALSGTYEGVMALHRMMAADEPGVARTGQRESGMDEKALRTLMQDPKYWREQDPALVAKVRQGFERLYPG